MSPAAQFDANIHPTTGSFTRSHRSPRYCSNRRAAAADDDDPPELLVVGDDDDDVVPDDDDDPTEVGAFTDRRSSTTSRAPSPNVATTGPAASAASYTSQLSATTCHVVEPEPEPSDEKLSSFDD